MFGEENFFWEEGREGEPPLPLSSFCQLWTPSLPGLTFFGRGVGRGRGSSNHKPTNAEGTNGAEGEGKGKTNGEKKKTERGGHKIKRVKKNWNLKKKENKKKCADEGKE